MRSLVLPLLLLALAMSGCGKGREVRAERDQLREQLAETRADAQRSMETVRDTVRQMHEMSLRDQAGRQVESTHTNQRSLMGVVLAILGGALAVALYARIRARPRHAA